MGLSAPSDRNAWQTLPLAVVLATVLYASGFWLLSANPISDPADAYGRAATFVNRAWRTGDVLATRPFWAARAREYLGDRPMVQVRDLAAEDLSRHRRLWLLSAPGATHSPGGPFDNGKYRLSDQRWFSELELRLYELPEPAQVVFDFRAELQRARVAVVGKRRRECAKWVENRWVCPDQPWEYVGRMVIDLDANPREAIWAHPNDEGPIEITYPTVPGGRILRVYTGLTPAAARVIEGTPIEMEVLVAGKSLARLSQANLASWNVHDLDISNFGSGPYPVTLRIKTKNVNMRHFCFQAEVRK